MAKTTKRKTKKRGCPWEENRDTFKKAHGMALALFGYGDSYLQAVCEVVTYAKDGSSRRRQEMLEKALRYQRTVRELFAFLDPEHYKSEVKK